MKTTKPKLLLSNATPKKTQTIKRTLNHDDVYALVKKIPKGKVATYGQIAVLLDMPRHARHVGNALSALPTAVKIPWQRVVNSQGRVSLRLISCELGNVSMARQSDEP